DANDEYLFVMRPVVDSDHSARWELPPVSPEVVVQQLLCGRDLETVHRNTLRIQSTHHMLDGAVLSSCVHPLQHDEQRETLLCGKLRLQIAEQIDPHRKRCLRVFAVAKLGCVGWVEVVRQLHSRSGLHSERRDETAQGLQALVRHGCLLYLCRCHRHEVARSGSSLSIQPRGRTRSVRG